MSHPPRSSDAAMRRPSARHHRSLRFRFVATTAINAMILALFVTGGSSAALAQGTPHLTFESVAGGSGATTTVRVFLDNPEDTVSGFSFSLCHEPGVLEAIEVNLGADLDPGTWFSGNVHPDGITVGAAMGFHVGGTPIPPGVGNSIAEIRYNVIGEPGDFTSLQICSLGSPPVGLSVVVSGASITPTVTLGSVTVGSAFLRGNCNGDAVVDLADPIFVEQYLFAGGEVPPCLSACDANDDGLVNIADSITTLSHLFSGSGPLPLPFPLCGADPTEDELSCADMETCMPF